jgi:4-diphosphocytidyl-2-C-methyl-D-erythritol kinase
MALRALFDVPAPAKLNLFLHVTGRRADGYHLLQSLFVPIDWADTLHFESRADGGLTRHDLGPALPAEDLCVRAASALQQASGTPLGVDITLDKHVPWGAGLGGGSSDAASTLLALNRLWGLGWPRARLVQIGLALGADVPFFLDPRPALVEGVGERIEPVGGLPGFALLLAHPGVALATRDVYAQYDASAASLTPPEPGPSIRALLALREEARAFQSLLVNDLEPAATLLCPVVAELRKEIEATGASAVSLAGSGPTVFGVFASADAAGEAKRRIGRRTGLRTWVVKTAPSDATAPGPRPAGA